MHGKIYDHWGNEKEGGIIMESILCVYETVDTRKTFDFQELSSLDTIQFSPVKCW